MKLDELLDSSLLAAELTDGYVRSCTHPTLPYVIFNYTAKAQFDKHWNDVTRTCRGLIVNYETNEIVARPFPKFFNAGEHSEFPAGSQRVDVYEKLDGSLGVLYREPDGQVAISTRGSFVSQQAVRATDFVRIHYPQLNMLANPEITYLFEIIYPENRIVVDYQGKSALILLAAIHTETGRTVPITDAVGDAWPTPYLTPIPFGNWQEALEVQRPNREGFVLHFVDDDLRIKVKHDEYVRLHRILTGVSTKTLWELLSHGIPFDDLIEHVPDEFHQWVLTTKASLQMEHAELVSSAKRDFVTAYWDTVKAGGLTRKDYALRASVSEHRGALFRLVDGRPIDDLIWKNIRPAFARPFTTQNEDVA